MVFDLGLIYDHLYLVHFDPLSVTEFLVPNERNKFHHFSVRLDLRHVLLDGQLFALEQARLLTFVDVQTGKRVHEKVCLAVVLVPLNHDVRQTARLFLLFLLEFNRLRAEVVRVD